MGRAIDNLTSVVAAFAGGEVVRVAPRRRSSSAMSAAIRTIVEDLGEGYEDTRPGVGETLSLVREIRNELRTVRSEIQGSYAELRDRTSREHLDETVEEVLELIRPGLSTERLLNWTRKSAS
jgi:hypothetical protein